MSNKLELLPAIDVKSGKAVRLYQGEFDSESAYGSPLEVALEFQSSGAEWIHSKPLLTKQYKYYKLNGFIGQILG